MSDPSVITLDLHFQDTPSVIASYLIPHREGAILIESGPGSTQRTLLDQLRQNGLALKDITDVFLTHIHLDHAGAAGWLARNGIIVHVHPVGAPHLVNPEKLLSSAARIYGDDMDRLWGEFLPVPEERLSILTDKQMIDIHGINIFPLDTPGHANHHMCFIINDVCFSGDVGGVRLEGFSSIRVPSPPPDFFLEKWITSIEKISEVPLQAIAPTHFGLFQDPAWHLDALRKQLAELEKWIASVLNGSPDVEQMRNEYASWIERMEQPFRLSETTRRAYELAIPSWMSADGILRYWKKYR